jgi:hypothetical protein
LKKETQMMNTRAKQIFTGICLIVIGLGWAGLIQFGYGITITSVASSVTDEIDYERKDLSGDECRKLMYSFAGKMKKSAPNVFLPVIPLGIGFFLVGYACKKTPS